METLRLSTSEEDISRAGEIIRDGGLVAFPTETVYGLGADALNAEAVGSVYKAKGRPSDNPMIVHISYVRGLDGLIRGGMSSLDGDALKLIGEFWPGPLTMVFRKSARVPAVTTGGLDTVAVRMPSSITAREMITEAGCPVAAPSANRSGKPSPTTAEDVLEDMDGRIDAVIMGEQCTVGIESTVLDMTGDEPVILRPGAVTREQLTELLGREVKYHPSLLEKPATEADPKAAAAQSDAADAYPEAVAGDTGCKEIAIGKHDMKTGCAGFAHEYSDERDDFRPKSPGMKYRHYSPKAKVRLIKGSTQEFTDKAKEIGLEARIRGEKAAVIDYGSDAAKAAHNLFADLRELDRQGCDIILIRALDEEGFGFSVMNRMLKSAGYDII